MIQVIDDICGAGKTTYIINHIKNELQKENDTRFIYVTPYLDEVKRIREEIPTFKEPVIDINNDFKKKESLLDLIFENENICTTHALFRLMDGDLIRLLQQRNYVLIIDEVLDVVSECPISKSDCKIILQECATVDKSNKVVWRDMAYTGKYNEYKRYALNDNLYLYNNQNKSVAFFWNFPYQVFSLFNDTYILTYMFDCQIMAYYLQYHNIVYKKFSLDSNTHKLIPYTKRKLDKNLFDIIGDNANVSSKIQKQEKKYNSIGKNKTDLSKSWYGKKEGKYSNIQLIEKQLRNVRETGFKCDTGDLIWTTFKDEANKIKFSGAKQSFLSCSARAMNQYQDRHFIMYGVNLFLNPILKKYFKQQGIETDEDKWALSMLIQFVFRSAIRNGEKVRMYIPSKRMRKLFLDYIA